MWRQYNRRYYYRRKKDVGATIFALFILGLYGMYRQDSGKFFSYIGYLILVVVLFFVVRHLIRRLRRKNPLGPDKYQEIKVENIASSLDHIIGQTKYARLLWGALKKRGIDAKTEYFDGHKKIDIAILSAKLYIEVDGRQHSDLKQGIIDLKRDSHSYDDGFQTIHVSNSMIYQDVNIVADEIEKIARERGTHLKNKLE